MHKSFEHGKALQAEGRIDEAIKAYRAVSIESADSYKALNNLGTLLEASGKLDEALEAYQQAAQRKPDSAIILYNLGHALHRLGRLAEAVDAYLKSLNFAPDSPETHYNLGNALSDQARFSSAIGCYQRALDYGLDDPRVHSRLGTAYLGFGKPAEASEAYQRAIDLNPDVPEEHFHLGLAFEALRQLDSAANSYRRTIELDSEAGSARDALARVLHASGRTDEAIAVIREWLAYAPGHPIPTHMLAALTGESTDRADPNYVRTLFDSFAESFDQTLARLNYQAPSVIAELIRSEINPASDAFVVLDAGCGTGLCGPLLRSFSNRLVGVDLSANMLREAAKRDVYDELLDADLLQFLHERPRVFDLIVAADTFCYFGDLNPVFAASEVSLKAGGWLVFTLEELANAEASFKLNPHGRYSHAVDRVKQQLMDCGFRDVVLRRETLRKESGSSVAGLVIAARHNA